MEVVLIGFFKFIGKFYQFVVFSLIVICLWVENMSVVGIDVVILEFRILGQVVEVAGR